MLLCCSTCQYKYLTNKICSVKQLIYNDRQTADLIICTIRVHRVNVTLRTKNKRRILTAIVQGY